MATSFAQLGLDARLVAALAHHLGAENGPTPIQEASLPLILHQGRDALVRAPTGSGKTLVYLLPIIELGIRFEREKGRKNVALILVPTFELAAQVEGLLERLTLPAFFPSRLIQILNLTREEGSNLSFDLHEKFQATFDAVLNVYLSTPSRLDKALKVQPTLATLFRERLNFLAVDEADLMTSFGHLTSLSQLVQYFPTVVQTVLLSATLSEEGLTELKTLLLHSPALLTLAASSPLPLSSDSASASAPISHYSVRLANESEKYLLFYVLFRLKCLTGKTLVYAPDSNVAYKLTLFLTTFGVRTNVVCSGVKAELRMERILSLNRGKLDCLVIQDEEEGDAMSSRGLDFEGVAVVVHFSTPCDPVAYLHHVGRSGRGRSEGLALTLVLPDELEREAKLSKEALKGGEQQSGWLPFSFDQVLAEGFRYRVMDVLEGLTEGMVQRAIDRDTGRQNDQGQATTLQWLQGLSARPMPHLKTVPDYLLSNASSSKVAATTKNQEFRKQNERIVQAFQGASGLTTARRLIQKRKAKKLEALKRMKI